jgi:hypothetical protein
MRVRAHKEPHALLLSIPHDLRRFLADEIASVGVRRLCRSFPLQSGILKRVEAVMPRLVFKIVILLVFSLIRRCRRVEELLPFRACGAPLGGDWSIPGHKRPGGVSVRPDTSRARCPRGRRHRRRRTAVRPRPDDAWGRWPRAPPRPRHG